MSHLLSQGPLILKSLKNRRQLLLIRVSWVSDPTRNSEIIMFPQFKATALAFYSNRCLFHRKRQYSTQTFRISITKMKIYSMDLFSETLVTLLRASKLTLRELFSSVQTSALITFLTLMTPSRRERKCMAACLTIGSMLWTSLRWNLALSVFATT